MGRKSASLNILTLLMLSATAGTVAIVGLVFLRPEIVPAALRPPASPVLLPQPSPGVTTGAWPTLPPVWTAAPTQPPVPSATLPRGHRRDATSVNGGLTPLPNLNSTAQAGVDARVRSEAAGLRLRIFPGTAGQVTAHLDALTPLDVVGRTPDNTWLEVMTPDQQRGWVLSEFVEVYINLLGVPLTAGAALDASPTPIVPDEARVAAGGDGLRLRQSPGTAGVVLANLPALMALDIVGKTADNAWLEVVTGNGQHGWVMARYVEVFISLANMPVTGQAVEATAPPPTPTWAATAPSTQVGSLPAFTATPTPLPTQVPPTVTSPPTATWTSVPPAGGGDVDTGYITGISDHARQIYLAGLGLGNRSNVFSKVGDSITVAPQFLVPVGTGQYNLRDYGHLAEVVGHFSSGWARTGNPFVNTSLAAKAGWSSWSVLAASAADKSVCRANEPPLMCEYRQSRPAVALIMIGTNDVMSTAADAYRANLQRIVADSLQMGVIPVLSTIPPFQRTGYEARADELNAIIVAVAQENDVPVWHYWSALQALPNHGLSPDGVHPSSGPAPADFTLESLQYGYTVRNLTALQVLDAIWRQVINGD